MAKLHFTSWLREIVPNGPLTAGGDTVGAALDGVFSEFPHVRGYVLDERGQLRGYWANSGQKSILAHDGMSAFDPSATLAVHCGNVLVAI